jgi:peptidoglycan hydrolase CwlO-like protein
VNPGAQALARGMNAPFLTLVTLLALTAAWGATSPAGRAAADQVGSLSAQAKRISQQLVQVQLEVGAYQQQYSVASARVAEDERAIAATLSQIRSDRQEIAKRLDVVRRLAIETYVVNGSASSASGAGVFGENVNTAQTANEYADIAEGDLAKDVDELHTAQHNEQGQQQTLIRQKDEDQSVQVQQASYLSQANATTSQLQSLQSQVTGQLATAVAQQDAAQARAAAAAVAAAQRTTIERRGGAGSATTSTASSPDPPTTSTPSSPDPPAGSTLTDPTLPPFLQCVAEAESGDDYQAVSPNGLYMGAFQFSQATWNFAAEAAGLNYLVGVPPNEATKAEQDTVAVTLYNLDGQRPWLGDRCTS